MMNFISIVFLGFAIVGLVAAGLHSPGKRDSLTTKDFVKQFGLFKGDLRPQMAEGMSARKRAIMNASEKSRQQRDEASGLIAAIQERTEQQLDLIQARMEMLQSSGSQGSSGSPIGGMTDFFEFQHRSLDEARLNSSNMMEQLRVDIQQSQDNLAMGGAFSTGLTGKGEALVSDAIDKNRRIMENLDDKIEQSRHRVHDVGQVDQIVARQKQMIQDMKEKNERDIERLKDRIRALEERNAAMINAAELKDRQRQLALKSDELSRKARESREDQKQMQQQIKDRMEAQRRLTEDRINQQRH